MEQSASYLYWCIERVRQLATGCFRHQVGGQLGRPALPIALASFTIGANWALNFEKFREFASQVDFEILRTLLLDA